MSPAVVPRLYASPSIAFESGGIEWPSTPDDRTLGVVDLSILPHLDVFPGNTIAEAERWATEIGVPAYAIDDQTATKVTDGSVGIRSVAHRCLRWQPVWLPEKARELS